MYKHIFVAIDGSEPAQAALEMACMLAEQKQAKLTLLCVTDSDIPEDIVGAAIDEGIVRPSDYEDFAQTLRYPDLAAARAEMTREAILSRTAAIIAEEIAKDAKEFAKDHQVKEIMTLVRSGDVAKAILSEAKKRQADLVVVGSENREGLDALLHPSVAERVRKDARCPTMVLFQSR